MSDPHVIGNRSIKKVVLDKYVVKVVAGCIDNCGSYTTGVSLKMNGKHLLICSENTALHSNSLCSHLDLFCLSGEHGHKVGFIGPNYSSYSLVGLTGKNIGAEQTRPHLRSCTSEQEQPECEGKSGMSSAGKHDKSKCKQSIFKCEGRVLRDWLRNNYKSRPQTDRTPS